MNQREIDQELSRLMGAVHVHREQARLAQEKADERAAALAAAVGELDRFKAAHGAELTACRSW